MANYQTSLSDRNLSIAKRVISGEVCREVGEDFSISRTRTQDITVRVCKELSGLFILMYGNPQPSSLGLIRRDKDMWLEVINVNQKGDNQ